MNALMHFVEACVTAMLLLYGHYVGAAILSALVCILLFVQDSHRYQNH
jgi:hypothetical protein